MMHQYEFSRLDSEAQILDHDLDAFAASFDHSVKRVFPVWVAHLDGKLISYCHVARQVVGYPAIHPSITPRQTYEMGWLWHSKLKTAYGNPLMVMPDKFSDKLLSKMGLEPIGGNVFRVSD